ncbi:hypothetical protein COY07_04085 [Candidatus Peregrinibacteria bacterium CG_4_10_14_0_2_um_filter_43_11]|nr:MAG: hypothetical protein COY07_04085 [Candidatus Peregrinibacteria bacterium CG_4_10_14_0_2_um_filter_43_11]
MRDETHFLTRVLDKESEMEIMLEKTRKTNDEHVANTMEASTRLVAEAEATARGKSQVLANEAKEKARTIYKEQLASIKSHGRDVIENAKSNVHKAEKHVKDAFLKMFV